MSQKELFKVRTHGKCILAGEHAVLCGYNLLAKSIKYYYVDLEHQPTQQSITIETDPNSTLSNETIMLYFYKLLDHATRLVNKNSNMLKGKFYLSTNIPVSTGLGFSAAICIAVAHWIEAQGLISQQNIFDYARSLEDLFHGKSSGADVAASLHEELISFQINRPVEIVKTTWKPLLYVNTTNTVCKTSEAVKKVNLFRSQNKKDGKYVDQKMHEAVLKIISALTIIHPEKLEILMEGMHEAQECFATWDLITPRMAENMSRLMAKGAIAVKPTGSGGGGCIMSLWEKIPPKELANDLIPVL